MSAERIASRLVGLLGTVKPKTKQPVSTKVLNGWIAQAEPTLGEDASGGRLGWLIASSVAIAAVQRAVDADGRQRFLLKGGALLQHRLNSTARATKDVDDLVRGDLDDFIAALDNVLDEPWGPLTLRRTDVEVIRTPTRVVQPRRFDLILELRGVTWRRIQFEVAPDEAGISLEDEVIEAPPLSGFGLPNPDMLVGIAMRFQIAQNLHAVTDSHEPPGSINDRARDVVDLLPLRDLVRETGGPSLSQIRSAAVAVFEARAAEAEQLGLISRHWPPAVSAYRHWVDDYARAAASGSIFLSLDEAVAEVNNWVAEIDAAVEPSPV